MRDERHMQAVADTSSEGILIPSFSRFFLSERHRPAPLEYVAMHVVWETVVMGMLVGVRM